MHYPTDLTLLYDAMRKVITLTGRLCEERGVSGFRKQHYLVRKVRRHGRRLAKAIRAVGQGRKSDRVPVLEKKKRRVCRGYLHDVGSILDRAAALLETLQSMGDVQDQKIRTIGRFMMHGRRLMDQIRRRVLFGEKIPQDEKIFSVFEEHTEWINKGKAGVPQELGVKVAIMEDQYGFLLHHRVMQKEEDVDVLLPMLEAVTQRYPNVVSCSADKGFYSATNKERAKDLVARVIIPKKGKLSQEEQGEESEEAFRRERRKRSAVESAIHALENHGLDRCPDHGIEGFRRYVSLAVVARNLQIIGNILLKRELRTLQRRQRKTREKAA